MLEKAATDTLGASRRVGATLLKEVWSRLDAASQKPRPIEYLGSRAIRSIQGSGGDQP